MNYESDREIRREALGDDDPEVQAEDTSTLAEGESHATTRGAAAAGAVTGGVIGLTGGPVGAALGAVGGAIVGAAAERMMHGQDDEEAPGEAEPVARDADEAAMEAAPVARQAEDRPPTEVEEPVGEPLAEVEHKEPRPLI
jgi:phage tail tape-measure protein